MQPQPSVRISLPEMNTDWTPPSSDAREMTNFEVLVDGKILSTEEADFVANLLCHDKLYISFGFGKSSNFRPVDEHDENTSVLLMLSALILNGSDDEETNAGENGQSLGDDCIASQELNGGAISDSKGPLH
ncbi:hypothetical protein RHSIM_Rhsim06G0061700 [Rhododendron simsii]|uniref:Uncharacterized protein n=1 Tax=Rhododendron simsii TaxID=118357 RepID=A0A834LHJ9_RHOSS|nr:hypothetical protein RHSIM_Rhsim06G0061700 [Rhododendron simsii]